MSSPITVVIFGATGNQGGSVLRALAAEPSHYKVRAVTRSKTSAKVQKINSELPSPVEWVEADLGNPASLRGAVANADVVFGVTNFYDPAIMSKLGENKDAEFDQGKNLIDACVAEKVGFVVFSTLPSAAKITHGQNTRVLHFEGKYKIQEYLFKQPIKGAAVQAGVYFQNLLQSAKWNAEEPDTVDFYFALSPDRKISFVDIDRDTGAMVKYVIDHRAESNGGVFPISGGLYSIDDIAKAFTEVTGIKSKAVNLPKDYLPMDDLKAMCELYEEYDLFEESKQTHLERNKKVPHKFSTPQMFWETNGFKGPKK
ncbi:hypothetical protein TRVA0_032S00936 [Trichomonascus vanleenenianus]|uniref:NmrA/HSCARG family protein n=1 Tax=Trichomonascus vanleenenianus TaxID=2268995 RepID=UPI003ECB4B6E